MALCLRYIINPQLLFYVFVNHICSCFSVDLFGFVLPLIILVLPKYERLNKYIHIILLGCYCIGTELSIGCHCVGSGLWHEYNCVGIVWITRFLVNYHQHLVCQTYCTYSPLIWIFQQMSTRHGCHFVSTGSPW